MKKVRMLLVNDEIFDCDLDGDSKKHIYANMKPEGKQITFLKCPVQCQIGG